MKSLIASALLSLTLLGVSTHAKRLAQLVPQIHERSAYIGGWPLALSASESTGCPAYASVACAGAKADDIPLDCCPNGQTCFVTSDVQYCCPDGHDCEHAITDFPACANSTWLMYTNGYAQPFCCEVGQQATTQNNKGICEPADVAVPSNKLAPSASQDTQAVTVAASSAVVTSTVVGSTSTTLVTGTGTTTTATVGATGTASAVTASQNSTLSTQSLPSTTSSIGSTLTTTAGSVSVSASGTDSAAASVFRTASASASTKTSSSMGVQMKPAALGSVLTLCFAMGALVLMG